MGEMINFDAALSTIANMPYVHVDRESFLRKELKRHCSERQLRLAIDIGPAQAGIDPGLIDKLAAGVISFQTRKVAAISAATGLPGGFLAAGGAAIDVLQYIGHAIETAQKLAYLYGWDSFDFKGEDMPEATRAELTLLVGIMFGVGSAVPAVHKVAASIAAQSAKNAVSAAGRSKIADMAIYQIAKAVAKQLGLQLSKETFGKGVAKVVPGLGALVSGGISYVAFSKAAKNLQKHLKDLPPARMLEECVTIEAEE